MEEFNEGMGKPLKYFDVAVTFSEFPDEIALCVNISGCPCHCDNCSEPWLRPWVGTILTNEEIDKLIKEHPDITVFGLMGGDSNYEDCVRITNYIHEKHPGLKVGIYSGRDWLDLELAKVIDIYKVGRWVQPDMDHPETWKDHTWGPLVWPVSNQLYFVKVGNKLVNMTHRFREKPIGNWSQYIITAEDNKDLE